MNGKNKRRPGPESSVSQASIPKFTMSQCTTLKTHVTDIAEEVQRLNASMQALLETIETDPTVTEVKGVAPRG